MLTTAAIIGVGMGKIAPISKDLLIEGVVCSTKGSLGHIGNIFGSSNRASINGILEIQELLRRLDTEAEVSVIEAYISEINNTVLNTDTSKSSCLALHNVSTALKELDDELYEIFNKIDCGANTTWLGSWWYGYPDFTPNSQKLQNKMKILQQRFSLYMRLSGK